MSNYTQTTTFATKDALATGDPNKVIYGADIDTELSAIATAVATKIEDVWTNNLLVYAGVTTAHNVSATTDTIIRYRSNVTNGIDTASAWSNSDYKFTAPTTGYYMLAGNINFGTQSIADGEILRATLYVDTGSGLASDRVVSTFRVGGATTPTAVSFAVPIYLQATHSAAIYGYVNAWVTGTGQATTSSYLAVWRLR